MQKYILVRVLYSVITLWLLVTIVFTMVRLSGDPVEMKGEIGADPAYVQQPGVTGVWIARFMFSTSASGRSGSWRFRPFVLEDTLPVATIYFERLPNSLKLGIAAFVIWIGVHRRAPGNDLGAEGEHLVGQPGQDRRTARIVRSGLLRRPYPHYRVRGQSGLVPCTGERPKRVRRERCFDVGDVLVSGLRSPTAMPAFALGWYFSGAMLRISRSGMLDVLGSDYIKLVRLKGVPEAVVIAKHALKNAMIPILRH